MEGKRRWHRLYRTQRIRSDLEEWPKVVDVPYSEELGLIFTQ